MKYQIYKQEDYITSQWSGGTTTQLGIFPKGSLYADRQFIWRLSSATIDVEESDFTPLGDYNRILMVLKGQVILSHEDIRTVKLNTLEVDYFDGAYTTKSYGKITDYNLMTRKDHVGKLEKVTLTGENKKVNFEKAMSLGIFITGEYGIISIDGHSEMIRGGQQLIAQDFPGGEIGFMGEGTAIVTWVNPRQEENELNDDKTQQNETTTLEPKPEPNFKSDFIEAMKYSLTNFVGSEKIFKSLKEKWYKEPLYRAIERVDRLHIPIFLYVIGVTIISCACILNDKESLVLAGIIAWTLIDIFVISPMIYYIAFPKPVAYYIKPRAELTEQEKAIEKEREEENKALNRIMKKYSNSGKSDYMGY